MTKRKYKKIIKKYGRDNGERGIMLEMAGHGNYGQIMSSKSQEPLIPYIPKPPLEKKSVTFFRYNNIGQNP